MPASLKFELKLQDVVTRCCIAASQNGLRVMTTDQERSLDTLLNLFHSQIATISLDHPSSKYLEPWAATFVSTLLTTSKFMINFMFE